MDLSQLNPEELEALKSTIDEELSNRSGQMMEDLDRLLDDVREMRARLGISKAIVLKRLFPVVEGGKRGGRKQEQEAAEGQDHEENPAE